MQRFLFAAMAATAFLSAPAHAGWAVSAIKYKNNGAYDAYFNVQVQKANGKETCQGENTTGKGIKAKGSVTIQLDNSDNSITPAWAEDCLPKTGEEVWGVVYIDRGAGYGPAAAKKNCRKDGNKFYYHPKGGTLVVETRGTTENANRCRLVKKGGVEYTK